MAVATDLQSEQTKELELQARELVLAAAQILRNLGPERSRVGWLLEDTLEYLEDIDAAEEELRAGNTARPVEEPKKQSAVS